MKHTYYAYIKIILNF